MAPAAFKKLEFSSCPEEESRMLKSLQDMISKFLKAKDELLVCVTERKRVSSCFKCRVKKDGSDGNGENTIK